MIKEFRTGNVKMTEMGTLRTTVGVENISQKGGVHNADGSFELRTAAVSSVT
ncbi:MAG: hypothetical protein JWL97_1588 [Gemmatimonadales bacterium]|nr:hypothetical protein [Gemmatimonadales bacterium]